jgi:hypothetical protein
MNALDGLSLDPASFAMRDLQGQDVWTEFTPVFGSLTVVGATSYSGRYRFVGRECEFQVQFSAATSIASVAGTTSMETPAAAKGFGGTITMHDLTTNNEVGSGPIKASNSRAYLPLQPVSSDTFLLKGSFEV